MGQAPSSPEAGRRELRVEDPEDAVAPRGLALIAHGRFGSMDGPVVRSLAEYFRNERKLRVVTWDDLAVGGRGFQSDFSIWVGDVAVDDYNVSNICSTRKFTSFVAGSHSGNVDRHVVH